MNYTIRRLGPEDAEAYKILRLEMLAKAPKAFGLSAEEAADYPADFWETELSGDRAFFGGFIGPALSGSANFKREPTQKTRHRGWLLGMYVKHEARGMGMAGALVEAVLEHARGEVVQVHLGVGAHNSPARKLYERAGFKLYGTIPRSLLIEGKYFDEHEMVCFFDKEHDNE